MLSIAYNIMIYYITEEKVNLSLNVENAKPQ
jgi:hypothetical protein